MTRRAAQAPAARPRRRVAHPSTIKRAKKRKRSRDGKTARDHTAHAQKEKKDTERPKSRSPEKKRTQRAAEKANKRTVCAAEKANRAVLARKAAEYRSTKRAASAALAKVAPTLASLGQLVGDPLCTHVPKFVMSTATKALKAMQQIDQQARDALLSDTPGPMASLKEESTAALRGGKEAEQQLRHMLKAARSHVERQ